MAQKNIVHAGKRLGEANNVLIMLHGRGASAEDILSLAAYLNVPDFTLLAPQAAGNSWYPYSFLAPQAQNEPWLSSSITVVNNTVSDVLAAGIEKPNIYFLGFSQGACLTLEFVTRHAEKWGGVVGFTGGLIGDDIQPAGYAGDFKGTSFFIGTSNPDPHVPVKRVRDTEAILQAMHASVTLKIYDGMAHTISQDEINQANSVVFNPINFLNRD